jgi:hypothetical protein
MCLFSVQSLGCSLWAPSSLGRREIHCAWVTWVSEADGTISLLGVAQPSPHRSQGPGPTPDSQWGRLLAMALGGGSEEQGEG